MLKQLLLDSRLGGFGIESTLFFFDRKKANILIKKPKNKDSNSYTGSIQRGTQKASREGEEQNCGPGNRQSKKRKKNLKNELPTPQPGQKISQRVHFFDTMSICQCPQSTQEIKFSPLIRSYPIFENQHVPIMPNCPE